MKTLKIPKRTKNEEEDPQDDPEPDAEDDPDVQEATATGRPKRNVKPPERLIANFQQHEFPTQAVEKTQYNQGSAQAFVNFVEYYTTAARDVHHKQSFICSNLQFEEGSKEIWQQRERCRNWRNETTL